MLRKRGETRKQREARGGTVDASHEVKSDGGEAQTWCAWLSLLLKVMFGMAVLLFVLLFVVIPTIHASLLRSERDQVSVPGELVMLPDGRRLFFRCTLARSFSDEPVLLVMNGWAADYRLLEGLEGDLAAAFKKVCIYDRAGIGYSDPAPPGRDALTGAVEDLNHLLDVTELRRPEGEDIVLLSMSYGGCVAMKFATEHPENIGAVLAVDPPFFLPGANLGFDPAFGRSMLTSLAWLYESGLVRVAWLFGMMEPSVSATTPEAEATELSTWKYLNARKGGGMAALRDEGHAISKSDWSEQDALLRQLARDDPVPLRMLTHEYWIPGLDQEAHDAWKEKSMYQKDVLGSHCTFLRDTDHGWALGHQDEFVAWIQTQLKDLGLM